MITGLFTCLLVALLTVGCLIWREMHLLRTNRDTLFPRRPRFVKPRKRNL